MSSWVYIDGVVTVAPPGRTQSEKRYVLETILAHLPKVTGSEYDMYAIPIQCKGYDEFDSHDEFGVYKPDGVEIQGTYKILLYGSLRDRKFDETFVELNKFLNRLAKRVVVEDILVKIEQYDRSYIFSNRSTYQEMWEKPSMWSDGLSKAWWEYLMWDRCKDSDMPLELNAKYGMSGRDKEEYDRRVDWRMRDED